MGRSNTSPTWLENAEMTGRQTPDPRRNLRVAHRYLLRSSPTEADGGWARALVQKTRGLSRHHNHTLKDIFKGAATTVIIQGKDGPPYDDYRRLMEAGTKPNLAKLTLARKIAATVLRMWKSEEVYRPDHARGKTRESTSRVEAVV